MQAEGLPFRAALERMNGGAPAEGWTPRIKQEKPKPVVERVTCKPPTDQSGGFLVSPKFEHRDFGAPSAIIPFRDAEGDVLGYECRWQREDGKESRMMTWGARGDKPARWEFGHFSHPRPLYGLDTLAAMADAQTIVFEGSVKARDAQAVLVHHACVAWSGGARSWHRSEWAPLAGRSVVVWPDNDEPGLAAGVALANLLADPKGLGCTPTKLVDPNRMPEGWDIRDALAEGWDAGRILAFCRERAGVIAVEDKSANLHITTGTPPELPAGMKTGILSPVQQPGGVSTNPETHGGGAVAESHAPATSEPGDVGLAPGLPAAVPDFSPDSAVAEALASVDGSAQPEVRPKRTRTRSKPILSVVEASDAPPDPEDDTALPAGLSEDRIADHFAAAHKDDTRYCQQEDCWFHWNGSRWEPDPTETRVWRAVRQLCRQVLEWPEAKAATQAKRDVLGSQRTAGSVLRFTGRDHRIGLKREAFDRDPWLLASATQVWDLRVPKQIEAEREQLITRACSVDPVRGEHPLFDAVLAMATGGNDSLTAYLWRWFGYLLTGDVREEAFLFLRGDEGSGKGTLVKAIAEIMGTYAWACSMDTLTDAEHTKHPTSIAALDGPRFVYASETNVGRSWNEALVNWLTGRDRIVARRMRMDEYQFEARFKLLVYGNYRPHIKGGGMGLKRRIKIIEYQGKLSPDDVDRTLKDRLRAEYPAILHSMIQSCVIWQQAGIGEPEEVSVNLGAYLDAEDSFGAWLEERTSRTDSAREAIRDLYADYKGWAKDSGEWTPSTKRFAQLIEARGYARCRPGGVRSFSGLRLLNAPAPTRHDPYR